MLPVTRTTPASSLQPRLTASPTDPTTPVLAPPPSPPPYETVLTVTFPYTPFDPHDNKDRFNSAVGALFHLWDHLKRHDPTAIPVEYNPPKTPTSERLPPLGSYVPSTASILQYFSLKKLQHNASRATTRIRIHHSVSCPVLFINGRDKHYGRLYEFQLDDKVKYHKRQINRAKELMKRYAKGDPLRLLDQATRRAKLKKAKKEFKKFKKQIKNERKAETQLSLYQSTPLHFLPDYKLVSCKRRKAHAKAHPRRIKKLEALCVAHVKKAKKLALQELFQKGPPMVPIQPTDWCLPLQTTDWCLLSHNSSVPPASAATVPNRTQTGLRWLAALLYTHIWMSWDLVYQIKDRWYEQDRWYEGGRNDKKGQQDLYIRQWSRVPTQNCNGLNRQRRCLQSWLATSVPRIHRPTGTDRLGKKP